MNQETRPRTFNIAIIISRFNEPVTEGLLNGALGRLAERGFSEQQILISRVPGAVEIPLVAQRLARQGTYKAIVCLGAVIEGETRHFDYVCSQVSNGCQKVALDNDLPVIFGILTTQTAEQAYDRVGGKKGHKGIESIDCACEMVTLLSDLG